MDSRIRVLNKAVRGYDKDLFVRRDSNGVIHLFRKKQKLHWFEYNAQPWAYSKDEDQHILSLTVDWRESSRGVEWGIEPLMRKIRERDSWRDDTGYDEFCKHRERMAQMRRQSQRNEYRALAADMRRDFAKATNDIVVKAGDKRI